MLLHVAGNALGSMSVLTTGRAEWEGMSAPPPLIWDTGVDAPFVLACAAVAFFGALTAYAYTSLASETKRARQR